MAETEKKKTMNAKISDAKIKDVFDIWKKKPHALGFCDTDAIIVSLETDEGKKLTHTFFVCLKPDGTVNRVALSRRSRMRREELAQFLRRYKIADNLKGYNIVEDIKNWKGKTVQVVKDDKHRYINIY